MTSERTADGVRLTATMHVDPRRMIYRRDDSATPLWLRELRRDKREQVL